MGQRRVEQHLQAVHHARHLLGLLARGLLAEELLALALALRASGHVPHEEGEQRPSPGACTRER